jgi:hypothetical protein
VPNTIKKAHHVFKRNEYPGPARLEIVERHTVGLDRIYDDVPEPSFLVNQLIPSSGVVLLSGEPGGGKSWVAYDLIRAASTGTSWLGRSAPANDGKPISCLLLDFDNGAIIIKQRFLAIGVPREAPIRVYTEGFDLDESLQFVVPIADAPDDESVDRILAIVEETNAKLIVVDSLRQASTGDENNNTHNRDLMRHCKNIARAQISPDNMNRLVVLLHHTAKRSAPGPFGNGGGWESRSRGGGEVEGSCDACIEIRDMTFLRGTDVEVKSKPSKGAKIDERKMLVWTKMRGWGMPDGKPIRFEIRVDTILKKERLVKATVRATGPVPGYRPSKLIDSVSRVARALRKNGKKPMPFSKVQKSADVNRVGFEEIVQEGERQGVFYATKPNAYSRQRSLVLGKRPDSDDNGT